MKKRKILLIILFTIIIIFIILKIVTVIYFSEQTNEAAVTIKTQKLDVFSYNLFDLLESISCNVEIESDNGIIYQNDCNLKVTISNFDVTKKYEIEYGISKEDIRIEKIEKDETTKKLKLKEGQNNIIFNIYCNEKLLQSSSETIYYIEPYKEQFLDELSNCGISTHYIKGYDDIDKTLKLLEESGIKNIRNSIRWDIIKKGNTYDFTSIDQWMSKMQENEINVIAILLSTSSYQIGSDLQISDDTELQGFLEYIGKIYNKYPNLQKIEVWNEPNIKWNSEEGINRYAHLINETRKLQYDKFIISGSTAVPYDVNSTTMKSEKFLNDIALKGAYENSDAFSYHIYNISNEMEWLKEKNTSHTKLINDLGGFQKQYITEFGIETGAREITEQERGGRIVKQKITNDYQTVDFSTLYNFIDDSDDVQFGLLNQENKPKEAYYIIQNFCENTNGAEYIGTINLVYGLEAHVYDKDGKPKIIAWSTDSNNNISIPYESFTASDIYGNYIENTNGTLTITTSPVYLDNVPTRYFYEAISNTALEKYTEFEEKFGSEISIIDGMQEQINKLKDYMTSIKDNESETQEKAVEMMHEHFYLGTMVLDAFSKEKLNVEYVKVSSMLDILNDIGDSYEDLLTVSATSREAYYTATEELINKAETTINNNSDLNILYPSKILDFAKELHEKSEYIIGLEEENDIKTGLIVSNSLHAYYLADWANDFANIYVNKYIKQNPVTVSYSNTDEFTNQDVTVTLNIGSDSKVTNNEGKNTYTFTKNGTFTFEYERRGQAFEEKITITSIDKEAPTISGVANGKIYTDSAKPVIKDENLEKVEVLFNGTNIQFNSGNTLKDEGIYNITATDKAGNVTSIEIYIVEKGEEGYIIENGYILNVRQKTTVNNFATKINLSSGYIIKRNDKTISNKEIIATGDILQLKNGAEYTIVVAGDINKDGKVTTYDLSTFRRYILGLREFDELESLAADINVDKQALGVKDYTRMRIEILGEY